MMWGGARREAPEGWQRARLRVRLWYRVRRVIERVPSVRELVFAVAEHPAGHLQAPSWSPTEHGPLDADTKSGIAHRAALVLAGPLRLCASATKPGLSRGGGSDVGIASACHFHPVDRHDAKGIVVTTLGGIANRTCDPGVVEAAACDDAGVGDEGATEEGSSPLDEGATRRSRSLRSPIPRRALSGWPTRFGKSMPRHGAFAADDGCAIKSR